MTKKPILYIITIEMRINLCQMQLEYIIGPWACERSVMFFLYFCSVFPCIINPTDILIVFCVLDFYANAVAAAAPAAHVKCVIHRIKSMVIHCCFLFLFKFSRLFIYFFFYAYVCCIYNLIEMKKKCLKK